MTNLFIIMMIVAMFAAFGSLAVGILSMVKGGDFNKKHGNKLMQARVGLQGCALLFLMLAWMTSGK